MWTCSFSCLSFLGSLDLAAVCAESSIFQSIVKCLRFHGLIFHDHTEQHFGSSFFFLLCFVSMLPLIAGPLKIWGISCCLTLINGPHLYQLKWGGGGRVRK